MVNVLGLALYGPLAASTRYRLQQYVPGLAQYGVRLQVRHLLGDDYLERRFSGRKMRVAGLVQDAGRRLRDILQQGRFDAAMLYCELMPLLPGIAEAALLRLSYVYDFDDAFYLKYRSGRLGVLRAALGGKIDHLIQSASSVTAGNHVLTDYAARHNPRTHCLPTVVDTTRYVPLKHRRAGDAFTVGWIGSPSTAGYLDQLVEPLTTIGQEGPVRLVVIGGKAPQIPGAEVVELPWSERDEIDQINSFNVGVMPLPDTEWARGKCAFKLIQYMACAVPVIASPVGANVDVVNGSAGLLAGSPREWVEGLRALRDSPARRASMGDSGRARIEQHYSLERYVPILAAILRQAAGKDSYVRNSRVSDS